MPDQLFAPLHDDVVVHPIPAREVRRRGDRRRRRRQTGAVVGGVAAIAAVALPITLTQASSDRSLPSATTSPSAVITVPAGFPLTDGLPARDGVSGKPLQAGPLTTEAEKACGQIVWSAQRPITAAGGASVAYHDVASEGGLSRTLALYSHAEQARRVLQEIGATLSSCTTVDNGGGRIERLSSSDSSGVWVVRWTDEHGDLTGEGMVNSATRVGNALLLDSATFGSAGSDVIVQQEAARLADRSAAVVTAMRDDFGG